MDELNSSTEQKIFDAAEAVFIKNGMEGARMKEIADIAGINKALLHYYYRNKEQLFMAVFQNAVDQFIPNIYNLLISELSLFDKIRAFLEQYGKILMKKQFLPLFILHEINRKPDKLVHTITSKGIQPQMLINQINEEVRAGSIKPIEPRQLIVNLLSLCIFPIAGRPMFQRILFDNDADAYESFLHERMHSTADFIINAIKK